MIVTTAPALALALAATVVRRRQALNRGRGRVVGRGDGVVRAVTGVVDQGTGRGAAVVAAATQHPAQLTRCHALGVFQSNRELLARGGQAHKKWGGVNASV